MDKFKIFFQKFADCILIHSVKIFILLFVLLCALAGVIFYFYGFLTVNASPEVKVEKITIGEELYQEVIDDLNARSQYQPPAGEYKNPFK